VSRRQFFGGALAVGTALLTERSWSQLGRSSSQVDDPTEWTLAEASRLIRDRALSPIDLVNGYLERIARLDSQLNAYITVTDERALSRARALESELSRGHWRGPLHGIPVALKDNIDTAAVRTTAGSAVFGERIPTEDAEVVRRLEAAGAIVLGKLNLHEFAYGATSAISYFGPVANPWDLKRIPGGSSGGSAAAVAARLCAAALGTDTGGSVRIPAAYCGIVALKPTYGLASVRGIVPLAESFDHVGPMCRTVTDAALMLQSMVGYDPLDEASVPAYIPDYLQALTRPAMNLRLGVPRSPYFEGVDSEIAAAVDRALELLSHMTAGRQDVELPAGPQVSLISFEAYRYHRDLIATSGDLYQASTLERLEGGAGISAAAYAEGRTQLARSREAISMVFEDVDLLITPTMATLPITIDEAKKAPNDGVRIRNTIPFNAYGIPTISVPCGFSAEGLPIGLQISGRPLGEEDVLTLAYAFEQATEWHRRVPPIAE
jgi:aspartyl-tRNA(Asn)/glutamyl-tRNA(Gln) amidotransferase subunit A